MFNSVWNFFDYIWENLISRFLLAGLQATVTHILSGLIYNPFLYVLDVMNLNVWRFRYNRPCPLDGTVYYRWF